jgi:hypothetical protein
MRATIVAIEKDLSRPAAFWPLGWQVRDTQLAAEVKMRATLQPFEKKLIEGVLELANLPERPPEEVPLGVALDERWQATQARLRSSDLKKQLKTLFGDGQLEHLVGDQHNLGDLHRFVRELLGDIASGNVRRRANAQARFDRWSNPPTRVDVSFKDGVLSLSLRAKSFEQACWYAIALVLDQHRRLTTRLGQCGAPDCGRFNLTFGGKPRRHCSAAHAETYRRAGAPERMRRSRDRRKRASGTRIHRVATESKGKSSRRS